MLEIIKNDRLHHRKNKVVSQDKSAYKEIWEQNRGTGLRIIIMPADEAIQFFSGVERYRDAINMNKSQNPCSLVIDMVQEEREANNARELMVAIYFYNNAIVGITTRDGFNVSDIPKELVSQLFVEDGIKKYIVAYPLPDSQLSYKERERLKAYIKDCLDTFSENYSRREMSQFEADMKRNSSGYRGNVDKPVVNLFNFDE